MNVAHVIVDNLGGITSLVQNLIIYRGTNALPQELVLLDIKNNPNANAILDSEVKEFSQYFTLNPLDNWYYTYRKLAKSLRTTKGILVSNDQYDLIMLQSFNIPRKVLQLVHDSYNLELSLKFHEVIDCFVTHSRYIYELLVEKLPHRIGDIKFIPYGIPLHLPVRKALNPDKPLQMVFLGRHDVGKGVYDLYEIDKILKRKNINVKWLILGKGPETEALKEQWGDLSHVQFETPISHNDLIAFIVRADIMVFPTKFEGFPVALLECMSQGCVPVVTDLPGGIRELVVNGENGFKCKLNDNEAFALAIEMLNNNREYLLEMQNHASRIIFKNHNAATQIPIYQETFYSLAMANIVPRHHAVLLKIGSRLDHPLIPNKVTSLIRNLIKRLEP